MATLRRSTHFSMAIINGALTGAIAAFAYATFGGSSSELWQKIPFHPLHYLFMIAVCILNTLAFLWLIERWTPVRGWKGLLLGVFIAVVGSFLCSIVMSVGTGRTLDLLAATLFFIPLSAIVGGVAGLVLALLARKTCNTQS